MIAYYNEFKTKIFLQSFSTGIYLIAIIFSSWTTVYYFLHFLRENKYVNIPIARYWEAITQITSLNLGINCIAITMFVIFKVPLNFFEIFNRHYAPYYSFYQPQEDRISEV